jgi:type II secretory pathway component GspD/PulD (secretin)
VEKISIVIAAPLPRTHTDLMRTAHLSLSVFGLVLATATLAFAEDPIETRNPATPPPPAAADNATQAALDKRHVTRELPLGVSDLTQVEEMLNQVLSPGAKFEVLKIKRTVRVTDTPESIEAAREYLKTIGAAGPNVRIEVTSRSMGNSQTNGIDISGRFVGQGGRGYIGGHTGGAPPGTIRRSPSGHGGGHLPGSVIGGGVIGGNGTIKGGAIDIDAIGQSTSTSSLNSTFIVVSSGRTAVIEVVREVPVVDFFLLYGIQSGFITPDVSWQKVGSQLVVKPIVSGDLVTVEVTPRISEYVVENIDVFRDRPINRPLTGRDQHIDFTQLTTTVVVQDGGTVTIGGFTRAPAEFNRYFWGNSRTSSSSAGSMTLKVNIQ